ncbi:MAG TPA: hypothetical protein VIR54_22250 [Vicinamibacterales bacterium]|jgi:hypothetical protein
MHFVRGAELILVGIARAAFVWAVGAAAVMVVRSRLVAAFQNRQVLVCQIRDPGSDGIWRCATPPQSRRGTLVAGLAMGLLLDVAISMYAAWSGAFDGSTRDSPVQIFTGAVVTLAIGWIAGHIGIKKALKIVFSQPAVLALDKLNSARPMTVNGRAFLVRRQIEALVQPLMELAPGLAVFLAGLAVLNAVGTPLATSSPSTRAFLAIASVIFTLGPFVAMAAYRRTFIVSRTRFVVTSCVASARSDSRYPGTGRRPFDPATAHRRRVRLAISSLNRASRRADAHGRGSETFATALKDLALRLEWELSAADPLKCELSEPLRRAAMIGVALLDPRYRADTFMEFTMAMKEISPPENLDTAMNRHRPIVRIARAVSDGIESTSKTLTSLVVIATTLGVVLSFGPHFLHTVARLLR